MKTNSESAKGKVDDSEKKEDRETDQPLTQWQFHQEESDSDKTATEEIYNSTTKTKEHPEAVTWTASEYIAHQKSVLWYLVLGLAAVVIAAGIYLLTHDKISAGVIIIVALIFGIYAARKPRVLSYRLDESGLVIGNSSYAYNLFKSFSLVEEDAFTSIVLRPLRRFMPYVSLYFEPKDEHKIATVLAEHLPVEAHKFDVIDKLMRKIRF